MLKFNWTLEEAQRMYGQPLPELMFQAQSVHRLNFSPYEIQRSTLLSIKTGGCPEDCAYCPQSAHYDTGVRSERLLAREIVLQKALAAKDAGSTRFCMGAAWRSIPDGEQFDHVIELVRGVDAIGMEVCCTLGSLTEEQALRLKEAGCTFYNHNLDTSPEFYPQIISTRTYEQRLETIRHVRKAGIGLCCGGIVGMGESVDDRLHLLLQLANQNPHPESVPLNMLVRVAGTPLENGGTVDSIEFVRTVACARLLMPKSVIRLSAGRAGMSDETQALCYLAGANSIFAGDTLLTTPNPEEERDRSLMRKLGMKFTTARCLKVEVE